MTGGLRNLGPVSTGWLRRVGIETLDDLLAAGPVEAYARVVESGQPGVSLNLLWGLAGAVYDIDWRLLDAESKAQLRDQLAARQPQAPASTQTPQTRKR